MTGIDFDTNAFVERLTAAGMTKTQAQLLASEQSALISRITIKISERITEVYKSLFVYANILLFIIVFVILTEPGHGGH